MGLLIMWTSLSSPWRESFKESWTAYCSGSIPIGAVIADGSGEIHAVGRSRRFEARSESQDQIFGTPLSHAEVNAILCLDFNRINPHECILYTTVEPCPLCVGAVAMSKIKTIMYAARDPYAGSSNLLDATPYMRNKNIKSIGPHSELFENIVISLQVDFFLRVNRSSLGKVMSAWERELPLGVAVGKDLYRSSEILRMGESGASAEEVFDFIQSKFSGRD